MKNINKTLSLILTICMLCSMLPVMTISVTATTATVNNEDEFINALKDSSKNTIILKGTISIEAKTRTDDALVIPRAVTIQGGGLSLRRSGLVLGGDVTFKDTSIYFENPVRNAIIANGYSLTLDSVSDGGSPYDIHLFCGGISNYSGGNTGEIPKSGNNGRITIKGSNNILGNIYAGSLSDIGNDVVNSSNTYDGAVDITIENDASGTIGDIYACGAREDRSGSPSNSGNALLPNPDRYKCTDNVTISLNNHLVKHIYGKTGGGVDATVSYTDDGKGYLFSPLLSNIGQLSIASSSKGNNANVEPISGSSFSHATVSLPAGTRLNLANLSDPSIVDFSGGGTLVLDPMQTLTITNTVTGTTKVAIGDVSFDGTSSTGVISEDHIYITAPQSTADSFSLLPSAAFPNLTLTKDSRGKWSTPRSAESSIVIDKISMSNATASASNAGITIPVEVLYRSTGFVYLSLVPISVSVNDKDASKTGDGNYGYTYTSGSTSSDIEFSFVEDQRDPDKEVLSISGYGSQTRTVPVGTYKFTFTIPKENMASGAPHTFTITLIVGDGTQILQENTTTTVSGNISHTYDDTSSVQSGQKDTHSSSNGGGSASIKDQGNTQSTTANSGGGGGHMPATSTPSGGGGYTSSTTTIPISGNENYPSAAFMDIDPNAWYHDAINYVLKNGLMNGYGDGLFGPNDDLSRGMLAQILYNLKSQPPVSDQMPYTDVAESRYYAAAIKWVTVNGIVDGYGGGLFGPDDSITREQVAVMLWRYSGSPVATSKQLNFSDADKVSDWAVNALLWASENKVVNGYSDATLNPKGTASRSQVAQMLKNLLENLK